MVNAYIERSRVFWGRLTANQRLGIAAVAITTALAVALLLLMRPPQRFETAFSGLASDDAAAIVDDVRSRGIPYQLSADGSTIRVPPDKVADVRLSAASKGLPKGGSTGFELFDKSSFGLTDFAQRVNYQRAIEGELERTINSIDAVSASRVHIVIPEDSLFTDQQQPTTAAVVLQLKPGQQLSSAQVNGITHLVSGAVPNLKPENLTVIDGAGNPIWSGTDGSTQTAGLDGNFRLQQAYEARAEQQLQTLVNQVVGNGNAVVRVNATLNWDQRTTDNEIYSPDGTQPQVRSQQEQTQSQGGSLTTPSGAPGVASNVQTYQAGTPTAGQQQTTSRDVTTNYELSRRVERIVQAPGQLQRLSVAVVLDGKQVDPAVAQQIQSVVSAAAGIVPQRGDTITVSAVPFSDVNQNSQIPVPGVPWWERVLQGVKIAGLILVPIVALIFARRVLVRQRELAPVLAGPGPVVKGSQRITVTESTAPQMGQPEPLRSRSVTHQQMLTMANSDPTQVAQLIRHWMSEEE